MNGCTHIYDHSFIFNSNTNEIFEKNEKEPIEKGLC